VNHLPLGHPPEYFGVVPRRVLAFDKLHLQEFLHLNSEISLAVLWIIIVVYTFGIFQFFLERIQQIFNVFVCLLVFLMTKEKKLL
jgi:hypothetical protein